MAAAVGLAALLGAAALVFSPQARVQVEGWLLEWMTRRALAEVERELGMSADPQAAGRATALDPSSLPRPQAEVAAYLSQRYRVAPEPMAALVAEAYRIGPRLKLSPNLLLAVAAVESRFHPFVQSPAGAQGLMQILSRVHTDRLKAEGGREVVFDPVVNLRLGARILHDAVRLMGGSLDDGLRFYLGGHAVDPEVAQGYIQRLRDVEAPLDRLSPPGQVGR